MVHSNSRCKKLWLYEICSLQDSQWNTITQKPRLHWENKSQTTLRDVLSDAFPPPEPSFKVKALTMNPYELVIYHAGYTERTNNPLTSVSCDQIRGSSISSYIYKASINWLSCSLVCGQCCDWLQYSLWLQHWNIDSALINQHLIYMQKVT